MGGEIGDEQRREMARELRMLRGGTGMRAGRVASCENLLAHLGTTPDDLHQRIVRVLRAMPQDRKTSALISAYALDNPGDPGILTDRRIYFGNTHEGRQPDTVEGWENDAIDLLLDLLLRESAAPDDVSMVPGEYAVEVRFGLDATGSIMSRSTELWLFGGQGGTEVVGNHEVDRRKTDRTYNRFANDVVFYQFVRPSISTRDPVALSIFLSIAREREFAIELIDVFYARSIDLNELLLGGRHRLEPENIREIESESTAKYRAWEADLTFAYPVQREFFAVWPYVAHSSTI